MKTKIKIEGLSQKVKNRIQEHGDEFFVQKEGFSIILMSTEPEISTSKWSGWFNRTEFKRVA